MQKTRLKSQDRKEIATFGLMGWEAEIINSSDRELNGVTGKIIDETLNTIILRTKRGDRRIQKKKVIIKIFLPSGPVVLDGMDLIQRPEERIKKWWRKIAKQKRKEGRVRREERK